MLPATKVRQDFFNYIKIASKPDSEVTITIEGEPKVVMMSYEDFEGWKETLEIMSDPRITKDIAKSLNDMKHGHFTYWEDLKKELKLP